MISGVGDRPPFLITLPQGARPWRDAVREVLLSAIAPDVRWKIRAKIVKIDFKALLINGM